MVSKVERIRKAGALKVGWTLGLWRSQGKAVWLGPLVIAGP